MQEKKFLESFIRIIKHSYRQRQLEDILCIGNHVYFFFRHDNFFSFLH